MAGASSRRARSGADGATISSRVVSRRPTGIKATVPSTVVGTLVDDGVFKDPFFGMNLRSLPGMTYKIGRTVRASADGSDEPVRGAVVVSHDVHGAGGRCAASMCSLQFDGINYRANIWLNGKRLADSSQVAGSYRRYELDVTDGLSKRRSNVLAVEIFAPTPPDLQTTWVDWNPAPPDKDMGLWQPVWLAASGRRDDPIPAGRESAWIPRRSRRADLDVSARPAQYVVASR